VFIYAAVDAFDNPSPISIIISLTISIGLNMVLYSMIGNLVLWFFRLFERKQ